MQQEPLASKLHPELNLNAEDGVLRIGPMRSKFAQQIDDTLNALGITTGNDDAIRIVGNNRSQAFLVVSGPFVTGYLMEDYGISAPIEVYDALVLKCCSANTPVTIEGHYHPDDETRIASVMTAVHDGGKVCWSHLRTRLRDGEQLLLTSRKDRFPVIDCGPRNGAARTVQPAPWLSEVS